LISRPIFLTKDNAIPRGGHEEIFRLSVVFASGCLALTLALALSRRRWVAGIVLVIGVMWLLYAPSLMNWINHLGSDSFSEAQNFDLAEALNFLESLNQVLRREGLRATALTLALGGAVALALFGLAAYLAGRRFGTATGNLAIGAMALIIAPLVLQLQPAFSAFRSNSAIYRNTTENFHGHGHRKAFKEETVNPLNVVLYIGESTSSLNMGIYGYPRQTTPELSRFQAESDNLLVFHNVFSTHTHTAPSLLEALSVGIDFSEDFFPINYRKRVSLVDLLNQVNIPSALVSNQGPAGTWNLASTVVFRNVGEKEFSFNSTWFGDLEGRASRPLDHEFLLPALERHARLDQPGPRLTVLHSYAGHGPYLRSIADDFKQPVDDFLEALPVAAIVGTRLANPGRVVRTIEEYDSSVRYVDHTVAAALRRVQAAPWPTAFVYFSDHGEAVYAGLRHDSSRLLHEMARIPYLVFFNDAAAEQFPSVFAQFREASISENVSTLAQFPASLLSLFGLEIVDGFYQGVGLDDAERLPPILTREAGTGFSYIRLGSRGYAGTGSARDAPQEVTDTHTVLFLGQRHGVHPTTRLCLHRANTVGKALRGAKVAECLHTEWGPPAGTSSLPTGYGDLDAILSVASGFGLPAWIAVNGLNSVAECRVLEESMEAHAHTEGPATLLMFSAETPWHDPDIGACIVSLRAKGFRIGLELPTEVAARCDASAPARADGHDPCAELLSVIQQVEDRGVFTALGIDFSVAGALENLDVPSGLALNTWGVQLHQIESADLSRFQLVSVELAGDPNEF
jgi:glucan phosphoethanolaminetransferase (alkaline phosphatase superfamily)